MKKIPLTQGKYALVDDDDFDRLNQYKWSSHKGRHTYYAVRKITKEISQRQEINMSWTVLNVEGSRKRFVDHINGNGLDNRKTNLRLCNPNQNRINCKIHTNNKSGYKGVYLKKNLKIKKWVARLDYKNNTHNLGYFKSKEEAARAYNKKAKELFGEFSRLNII